MLTKIKVYACYTVKIYKNKPKFFAGPGSAFADGTIKEFANVCIYNDQTYIHVGPLGNICN